ncbi:M48 family metalloprotease [Roseicella aerolata]|uniref:M48 family metalloprotease n=1 Tax=Roseicella aerolata TaxID=2883479 RepID=A0A9X1IH15_9PROT|nr:M48 family metalloprotease [Roseicella aerolata]MCB4823533.1 M48 family metalloprotease [Roseicella aerolata]
MPQAAAPADRTAFFTEQARRRRHARLWALLCLGLAGGLGAVLSTITGPLALLLLAAMLRLLAWLGLAPVAMLAALHAISQWVESCVRALIRGGERLEAMGLAGLPLAAGDLLQATQLLLPGMALAMLVWAGLARFHRRSAIAAAAADLGARPPSEADFEERQFGNIVAEMALAAGLPTPGLLVVDAPEPNAAAFGASHRDAAILATRGLLERVDRRETQGVVAHLVAALGSGDVRLAAAVQAVFGTLGAMLLVFDLPFRRGAWTALRDLLLALAGRLPACQAERLSAGLAISLSPDSMDAMLDVMSIANRWPPLGALLAAPLLPWMLLTLLQKTLVALWMLFVFGWPLALLWRARRYLADAVAVQLLRDPEALASALRRIHAGGLPPGGALQEMGFIHAPDGVRKGFRDRVAMVVTLTPPIARRLARLAALGAGPAAPTGLAASVAQFRALPRWRAGLALTLMAMLGLLLALLVVLVGGLMLAASAFSVLGGAMLAALILSL